MEEYEVICFECGEYFMLRCCDPMGWIDGACPHCGAEGEHEIVGEYRYHGRE